METIKQSLDAFITSGIQGAGEWAPKLLGALVALFIGFFIIRILIKGISRLIHASRMDATLKPFIITTVGLLLKALLFISVASVLGVEMTSFAALLGAVALAIGMAFQGSFGNVASGVMILIFKPFKAGDLIEVNGHLGFVREVSVFVTFLETFQNKTVIVPNGKITAESIVNFSAKGNVRADIPFAVRYDADQDKAQEIVLNILKNSPIVLQDPAPSVYVTNLGESSVEFLALPFCTVENYWDVYWGLRGQIKAELGKAGFEAPFKQVVYNQK